MVCEDLDWGDLFVLIVMSTNIAAYQWGREQFPSVIAVYGRQETHVQVFSIC